MEAGLLQRSHRVLPKLPGQATGILGGVGVAVGAWWWEPWGGAPQSAHVLPTDRSALLLARGGRTGRSLARLRLLETYLQTLLVVEHVSRGPALRAFFEPQPQDLEPSLPPGRYLPNS